MSRMTHQQVGDALVAMMRNAPLDRARVEFDDLELAFQDAQSRIDWLLRCMQPPFQQTAFRVTQLRVLRATQRAILERMYKLTETPKEERVND